jgi:hypothetical protein
MPLSYQREDYFRFESQTASEFHFLNFLNSWLLFIGNKNPAETNTFVPVIYLCVAANKPCEAI